MSVSELQLARLDAGPQLRLARLWWGLGWGMVLFILASTLAPERYVPDLHLWDKAEHALAFFGLTFWFGGLLSRARYPAIAAVMLLLGSGIELAQGAMNWGRDGGHPGFSGRCGRDLGVPWGFCMPGSVPGCGGSSDSSGLPA